ncbi:MAG: nicotinate-nucleotide adenylyltransferase [Planctomycetes bacterium]|nr:nicotinate-nucleotide adenylyltransferase [Planctomycetota bacterium]
MRIGVFGGTFDPIHLGHLVLAEQCREQCRLDEVWFVPAALPPHKLDAVISSAKTRMEMIEFAISGHVQFKVCPIELDREGPSYTVTTLEQLQAEDSTRELFLLVGADSIRDLPTWRQPQRILELATVVAVNRGRDSLSDAATREQLNQNFGLGAAGRLEFVEMPAIDISASDIRRRASAGRSLRYLVPRAVEMYIREFGIYCADNSTAG